MRVRAVGILLMLTLTACSSSPDTDVPAWFDAKAIEEFRATKDDVFRNPNESPIPYEGRSAFGGLRYFPIDARYAVLATFLADHGSDSVLMPTTHGEDVRPARRAGVLRFSLDGREHTLSVYQFYPLAKEHFFLAFTDSTTGVETYHGGRYLEISTLRDGQRVALDFNMAYNPYCAYNGDYACPLVPSENHLAVAIRAGERIWK